MEVPGSNTAKFFRHFLAPFLPHGDNSIRVFRPRNLQLFGFSPVTLAYRVSENYMRE